MGDRLMDFDKKLDSIIRLEELEYIQDQLQVRLKLVDLSKHLYATTVKEIPFE